MTWHYDPKEIAAVLEAEGFDIDTSAARLRGDGGSISGRRDEADRSIHVALDAGGRIRVTLTTRRETSRRTLHVPGGPALTGVTETSRQETLTGRLTSLGDLRAVTKAVHSGQRSGKSGTRVTPVRESG